MYTHCLWKMSLWLLLHRRPFPNYRCDPSVDSQCLDFFRTNAFTLCEGPSLFVNQPPFVNQRLKSLWLICIQPTPWLFVNQRLHSLWTNHPLWTNVLWLFVKGMQKQTVKIRQCVSPSDTQTLTFWYTNVYFTSQTVCLTFWYTNGNKKMSTCLYA